MSYLPEDELKPGDGKKRPTMNRIAIWLVAGGIGVYLVGTGVYGLLTK
jgi:hypothetical protein